MLLTLLNEHPFVSLFWLVFSFIIELSSLFNDFELVKGFLISLSLLIFDDWLSSVYGFIVGIGIAVGNEVYFLDGLYSGIPKEFRQLFSNSILLNP